MLDDHFQQTDHLSAETDHQVSVDSDSMFKEHRSAEDLGFFSVQFIN